MPAKDGEYNSQFASDRSVCTLDNNATIGEEPEAGDTFIWPDIKTTDDLLYLRYVTNKASKEKQEQEQK